MYGLVAWCPDLLIKGARGVSRGYVPRARPHVRPHFHSHSGGGEHSASSMSDGEGTFLCIMLAVLLVIALLYLFERSRPSNDDIGTPEQLRRARMMIEKRRC